MVPLVWIISKNIKEFEYIERKSKQLTKQLKNTYQSLLDQCGLDVFYICKAGWIHNPDSSRHLA